MQRGLAAREEVRRTGVYYTPEFVLDELEAIPSSEYILNGGLMTAMGFAREYARTGDPRYAQMTRDIVAGLAPYQNKDGSFPHWCAYSEDVHYTDWMAQELILIGRLVDDPAIEPLLARMDAFIEARVGDDGVTRYQGPCPYEPLGCVLNYWSLGTGCSIDVETRAYTNELGYTALLFDHVGSPKLPAVLAFLDSIEDGGVVADRWEGPIDPKDPYYPWTAADTSVVNMSLLFWSLAAMPPAHGPSRAIAAPSPRRTLAIAPNPSSGRVMIGEPGLRGVHAAGSIRDVRGRIVRSWTGPAFTWDGRDDRGMTCPRGVYLVELRTDGRIERGRVVLAADR